MPPVQVSLRGFAMIGTTLLVLAFTITLYLLNHFRHTRTKNALLLAGFFGSVAASGLATIATNAVTFWGPLFDPWQDAFVVLGGIPLILFAYRFPRADQPREAKIVTTLAVLLTLIALGYVLVFDSQFIFHYVPGLSVADVFYVLMPLGTLLAVTAFFRRAIHFSRLARAEATAAGATGIQAQRPFWWHLIHPQGQSARAHTGFGLGLMLGFLPGLAVLLPVPDPFDFLSLNIGSLLALAVIALVYFNVAPEMTSFMAKLVGITLLTLLVILSVIGTVSYRSAEAQYDVVMTEKIINAYQSTRLGQVQNQPDEVVYVVSWPTHATNDPSRYRRLYVRDSLAALTLDQLIAKNRQIAAKQPDPAAWGQSVAGPLPGRTGESWQRLSRYGLFPEGSGHPDVIGWLTTKGNTTVEIGQSVYARKYHLSGITLNWIMIILGCSLMVGVVFPLFFRQTLVNPLRRLLDGVARVRHGDEQYTPTTVPIQYRDEIGVLTNAFNTLTRSLAESYEVLEQRLAARTHELTAISELTTLATTNDDLKYMLEPALTLVLDAGRCQALALHLLDEDANTLTLIAHRNVSDQAAEAMQNISLTAAFTTHLFQVEDAIVTDRLTANPDVPGAFKLPGFQIYMGSPLATGDESHGWLSCYRNGQPPFSSGEVTFLKAMARQLGIIVENHRLRQRIGQVAVTEERQRLARDLHDSVSQLLYSLTLYARTGEEALMDGDQLRLSQSVREMQAVSLQALREMRSLLYALQPPALVEKGLAQVLAERVNVVERRVGIQVKFHVDPSFAVQGRLARELYFVTTEALNNSLKHASATQLVIDLKQSEGQVNIQIADNGRGFERQKISSGLGLQSMHSRIEQLGGTFAIRSTMNAGRAADLVAGTTVLISAPLHHGDT